MKRIVFAGWLLFVLAACLHAEEFLMKDGTRISGRIVAYKKDSFVVETSFGQAIVYKNKVARIEFSGPEKPKAADKKPPAPAEAKEGGQNPASAGTSQTASLSRPATPPAPPKIVDRVEGTSYINETFRFRMFKPPSWHVFPGETRGLGPAIVIMGTDDESTLLMVGRETFDGSLDAYATAVERQMARSYGNYRRISETRITVNGLPAVRRTFTGDIDGNDWYGLATYFARDQEQYSIVGLTTGELHDFTEGLFRKVVNTFEFLHP